MGRLLVSVLVVVALAACAKVAPNKRPPEGAYPRQYPYESPDLYNPTYPPDSSARDALRREDMRSGGPVF